MPNQRFRSRQYLNWVKQQPCCCCEAPADDPHHIKGIGHLSGAGLTAPDSFAIGLCRPCHDALHARPELLALQPVWLLDTLSKGMKRFPDGELHEALVEAHNWCWTFQLGERA
ncbi:DUF968 domain-containing protein [Phytohalomonas tamaricis]|uniref:DUF968 domain-containing protein n=1 Tax=Phytohalomonas tamaricis TaxID=2081032 RepID=UPI0021D457FA|nr:hypothetical protein [Phytohalomonas tamaricis]